MRAGSDSEAITGLSAAAWRPLGRSAEAATQGSGDDAQALADVLVDTGERACWSPVPGHSGGSPAELERSPPVSDTVACASLGSR